MLKKLTPFLFLLLIPVAVLSQSEEELLIRLENADAHQRPRLLNELSQITFESNLVRAETYAKQAALAAQEAGQDDQLALALLYQGQAQLRMMQLENAARLLRESSELYQLLGDAEKRGRIASLLAELYFRQNRYETSLTYNLEAMEIWEALRDTRRILDAMVNQAHIYTAMGQSEGAIEVLLEGVALRDRVLPGTIIPNLYLNLFRNYRSLGESGLAQEYGRLALQEAQQEGSHATIIDVNNALAGWHSDRGEYEQSYRYLADALERSRLMGSVFTEAVTLNNIGNNFSRAEDHIRALGFYRQSNRLFVELEHLNGSITTTNNIGLMFENLDQPDSALVYYLRGVALSEASGNPFLQTQSYNYAGNIFRTLGRYELSQTMLTRAYAGAVQIGSVGEQAKAASHFTELYLEQGDYRQALVYAEEFLTLATQLGAVGLQERAMRLMSTLYERTRQFEQSLNWFRRYAALRDSVAAESRTTEIAQIQEQLNLQLKEMELENKDLQLAQQALMLSATRERFTWLTASSVLLLLCLAGGFSWYRVHQSREKLLMEQRYIETEHRLLRSQMNPHFLFNALNSIQLYISEKDSLQAERYLSKFAKLMRYYLDSSFTSTVLLEEELEGLRLNVELEHLRLNKNFTYEITVSDGIEADHTEIPPMLAQPFVENAVKHGLRSKEEGGELRVHYEALPGGFMRCIIEDNGIGREAAAKLKKNNGSHTSRGTEITESRLKNIWKQDYQDRYLHIKDMYDENGKAAGTRVEITFPCM